MKWGLLGSGDDFPTRYLSAVAKSAAGANGVLSVNLPWSHQRWLTRFARMALPDAAPATRRYDAEVLEAWYPQTRYLYLTRADKAGQAAGWYLARRAGLAAVGNGLAHAQPPDFQEVRWIEALVSHQERAWEAYFQVHTIDAHRVEFEAFVEHPEETVAGILGWLGLPSPPEQAWIGRVHQQRLVPPVSWLPDYLAQRDQLSTTIGVRQGD
jgi:LPS sulfotransferase NodH